jgi:hypothetical protein
VAGVAAVSGQFINQSIKLADVERAVNQFKYSLSINQVMALELELTDYAHLLAKKVLVHAMEKDLEIAKFKHTINTMIYQLQEFAEQVTILVKEVGTEGRLWGSLLARSTGPPGCVPPRSSMPLPRPYRRRAPRFPALVT